MSCRLGKRSPLGAPLSPAAGTHAGQEVADPSVTMATRGPQTVGRRGHLALKVRHLLAFLCSCFLSAVTDRCGLPQVCPSAELDQLDLLRGDGSAWPPSPRSCCIAVPRRSQNPNKHFRSSNTETVSSNVRRSRHEVDVDDLMAAMILSSLSCGPLLSGAAPPHATGPPISWSPLTTTMTNSYCGKKCP